MFRNINFKKVLAIGCGTLVFLFLFLLGGTVYFTREMSREYKQVKALEEQLVAELGAGDRLPPGFDGFPRQERLDSFLAVRDATAEWRLKMESSFAEIMAQGGQEQKSGLKKFIGLVRASRDLAPVFSGFWQARNQAMLAQEMGIAEYTYLYCLGYYGYLGLEPSDGARDANAFLAGLGASGANPNTEDSAAAERERRQWIRSEINRLMSPLMQQAAREAASSADPEMQAWAVSLQSEVALLLDDRQRVPFQSGLPDLPAAALARVETRLRQSYSVTVNPVELIFEESWEGQE